MAPGQACVPGCAAACWACSLTLPGWLPWPCPAGGHRLYIGVNSFFVRTDILECQGVKVGSSGGRGWAGTGRTRASGGVACRLTDLPPCLLQPRPYEELYTFMKQQAWHSENRNPERKWIFLDEDGNEVRRKYKPI